MASVPAASTQPALESDPSREATWSREAVISSETTRQAQMGKIFGYTKGLHATHLIDLGVKLRLFEQVARAPGGSTPDALAASLGLHPPYVRAWCETACALELLDYDPATGYRLQPFLDEILGQPDATWYLGAFPGVHLQVARDYARYPETFGSGGTYTFQEHDDAFIRSVAAATQSLPRMFVDAVLQALGDLPTRLEAGATILDMGCGAGYALVEFAERFPNVRCVGLDIEPMSIDMANELIRSRGLGERIEARLYDGATLPDDLAGAADLVTMFLVFHEIRPHLKDAVLDLCARALRPGGHVLLFDEAYPSSPSALRDPALIYVVIAQWYELLWGNEMNTREEMHAMLARHGFRVADETSLSRFYIATAAFEPDRGVAAS